MTDWWEIGRVDREKQAIQGLVALLEQARRVAEMFQLAGMALPEPLQRLYGKRLYDATAHPPTGEQEGASRK